MLQEETLREVRRQSTGLRMRITDCISQILNQSSMYVTIEHQVTSVAVPLSHSVLDTYLRSMDQGTTFFNTQMQLENKKERKKKDISPLGKKRESSIKILQNDNCISTVENKGGSPKELIYYSVLIFKLLGPKYGIWTLVSVTPPLSSRMTGINQISLAIKWKSSSVYDRIIPSSMSAAHRFLWVLNGKVWGYFVLVWFFLILNKKYNLS